MQIHVVDSSFRLEKIRVVTIVLFIVFFDPWGQPWGPLEAEARLVFFTGFLIDF